MRRFKTSMRRLAFFPTRGKRPGQDLDELGILHRRQRIFNGRTLPEKPSALKVGKVGKWNVGSWEAEWAKSVVYSCRQSSTCSSLIGNNE